MSQSEVPELVDDSEPPADAWLVAVDEYVRRTRLRINGRTPLWRPLVPAQRHAGHHHANLIGEHGDVRYGRVPETVALSEQLGAPVSPLQITRVLGHIERGELLGVGLAGATFAQPPVIGDDLLQPSLHGPGLRSQGLRCSPHRDGEGNLPF